LCPRAPRSPAIDAHRSRIVKRTGDSALIVAAALVDAVRSMFFGALVQTSLYASPWPLLTDLKL
jgi:hypothetical protein